VAVEWALLAKAASPLVGKVATSALGSLTLPWQVSWRTTRRAGLHDVKVRFFRLHRVLRELDVLKAFDKGDWDHLKGNETAFADLIKNEPNDAKVTSLLKIVAESYVASLKPAEATAAQGQRIETLVETTHQATTQQIDARNSDDARFDPNLRLLSRFRAEEAKKLTSSWAKVTRAVAEIVVSPDRKQTIEAWADRRPAWMNDLPTAAECWLGNLARDYGARTSAASFYEEALSKGAVPRSYWKAKRALAADSLDQEDLRELFAGETPHPLSSALIAAAGGDAAAMREHLRGWQTQTPEDDCLRRLLLVDALNALGGHDEAITSAVAAADAYGTGTAHLKAAQNLLVRGSLRSQPNYLGDLQDGLSHALEARDLYRSWQADSTEAVLTTMRAYSLLGDNVNAWKTMQPPPEGTATEHEASNEKILTESCLLSAELGKLAHARDLLEHVKDPGVAAQVQALIADSEGNTVEANTYWSAAFKHAADPGLGLSIAKRMARRGLKIPAAEWENQARSEIGDLRLISEVFRKIDGSLQRARSRQLESRHVLTSLVDYHVEQGNLAEAAAIAERGAKRWHDPELWLSAALFHHEQEDYAESARCAESSLHSGGNIWRGQTGAYKVLIEAKSALGEVLEASEYAAQLFTQRPDDPATQWALITCQYVAGDVEGAWDTYKNRSSEPLPRSKSEVLTWIRLNRQWAKPFDVDRALDLAGQWNQDEEVCANVLMAIMLSDAPDRSFSTQQRFGAALQKFNEDFPRSQFFEPQQFDADDPMASLNQLVERLPDYSEQEGQINAGLLPVGMAAAMHNRSYAEIILSGGAGVIYGGDSSTLETELEHIDQTNAVVLDTTALFSLVLLDDDISRILLGTFSSAMTTIEQYRDAMAAADPTTFRSELSVYKDPQTGRARLRQTPADELETRKQRAKSLLELFNRTQRISNPNLLRAPNDNRLLPWLSALDLAERRDVVFWCDDRVMRNLGSHSGVKATSTLAVLEMARTSGALDPELIDVAEAVLIHNRYVGLTFNPKIYTLAAELSSWRPHGIAAAVIKHGPADADALMNFVLGAIQHVLATPEDVRDWVNVGAQWLVSVTGEPSRATEALVRWLWQLSSQNWMTPDLLVFAIEGVRSVVGKLEGVADPLPQAMNLLYGDLTERTDERLAAQFITGLISRTSAEDKGIVIRNILMS
jgi:tetratricopeptide (TPR) repeat protein